MSLFYLVVTGAALACGVAWLTMLVGAGSPPQFILTAACILAVDTLLVPRPLYPDNRIVAAWLLVIALVSAFLPVTMAGLAAVGVGAFVWSTLIRAREVAS
jgi:hypothetical protein